MAKKKILVSMAVTACLCIAVALFVLRALQLPYVDPPDRGVLTISGATIVQPGAPRLDNYSLILNHGLIESIAPSAVDDHSDLAELTGSYALPGLVDMHVHHMPDIGGLTQLWDLLFVAHGVTTVRDLGVTDAPDASPMAGLSKQIRDGLAVGPRILYCGPTLDGDPPSIAHFRVIRDEQDARAVVEELADDGCNCIKTYNRMDAAQFGIIHEAAEAKGLRHVAHLPFSLELSEAGGVELQHFAGIRANKAPVDFADQWKHWAGLTENDLQQIVATSREKGIAHTPTLSMWSRMSIMFDPGARQMPHSQLLPRFYRDVIWTADGGEPQLRTLTMEDVEDLAHAVPKMQRLTRMLYEAGVPVFLGTDPVMPHGVPGNSMHRELQLFVEAGFTAEEAWSIATERAGEWLGDPKLGRIEEGAYADILFFREDPTTNLEHLDTLVGVIADGRYYSRQFLDEALAQQRRHFEGAVYDSLTMAAARRFF